MTNRKKNEPKPPALIAFHVRDGKKGGNGFWTRIGAAWSHEDGEGFNVQLDCVPVDGRIVLRAPKAEEQAEEAGA